MNYKYFYIIILIFHLTFNLTAQDGILDTTFGSGGIVSTDVGTSSDIGTSVAIQVDGKIVVAGYTDFSLARYNIDGSLDDSFGSNGLVTDIFTPVFAQAYSLAIQSDGKIVVAGVANIGADFKNGFALVRFNTDGSLDDSFDSDGIVTTAFDITGAGDGTAEGHSVAIQSDGKIIIAGYAWYFSEHEFVLARYNTDGSLDSTFSFDGKVITNFGHEGEEGYRVAIQSDGKIIVAGKTGFSASSDFALIRYNTDGSLDSSFGISGYVTTPIGTAQEVAYDLAIQSDGKIVAIGSFYNGSNYEFALVRYRNDGSLDTSFGTGGKVTTDIGIGDDNGKSIAIQSDGKIVVVGWVDNGFSHNILAIARYNINGSLDTSFDSDGKVTYPSNINTRGRSVVIQSDGKIVIAGDYDSDLFFVTRYSNPSLISNVVAKSDNNISKDFKLSQNYPNPFNPTTTISYQIPDQVRNGKPDVTLSGVQESLVQLKIYDVLGKEVATLVNEVQSPGNYKVEFDASSLNSGIYFYKIEAGNFSQVRKMMLLK